MYELDQSREFFLHHDPTVIGAWCRDRAAPGSLFIAASASARRLVLQSVVARRGVSLGLTVASPSRLLPLLESRAGLPAPSQLSGALERMLILEAGRAARVPLFDDEQHGAPRGAIAALSGLIRTLRLNHITADQFTTAGGDARAANAYRRFEGRRQELGFHDEADRVARLISAGIPALRLILEDPGLPHRVAWDLLVAAISASVASHIGASVLAADGSAPGWTTELAALGFSTQTGAESVTRPAMRAVGGVGIHDEVELVSREMLALLRSCATVRDVDSSVDRPIRPSDLLCVAPNGNYLSLLSDACARLGIPVASPRRCVTAEIPLVRALLETFQLLSDPDADTPERGLALLGSPYLGLGLDRHDRLSRTLLLNGAGSLRSWHRFARKTRSAKFVTLATSVAAMANDLEGERAPNELLASLLSLGLEFGFLSSGRRHNLASAQDRSLRLDQQGWESLTGAAEELNDALRTTGTMRISARRWLSELTELVASSSVRMDARTYDGVHLTIAGAGLPSAPHVFAVGWREGLFPRRVREDPLLPERVKKALNAIGAMIPLATDRTRQEFERRERIVRSARNTLTVSWPSTGAEGEQFLPSFYLDDLGIADRAMRSVGETTWPLALAATRGERLARATVVARHRSVDSAGGELVAVRRALTSMSSSELRAYEGRLHAGRAINLPTEILSEMGVMAGKSSASQLRMVVHCLYEHFGKRRLRLDPLAAPQLDGRELGNVAHRVLNEVGRSAFDARLVEPSLDRWWAKRIPRELRENPQVAFEHEILLQSLAELIGRERSHLAVSGSRATFFELAFGLADDDRDPASIDDGLHVELPSGSVRASSTLRGSIDRVDVIERDGRRYGVAIDYKSGKGERYGKEMEEMADFQLPIYCEVLPRFGVEPVGAVYLGIGSGERYGVVRSDFAAAFIPEERSRGVKRISPEEFAAFMSERQLALRTELARVARGELQIKPRNDDCGYCDLRPVCRIGTFGVGGAHADD